MIARRGCMILWFTLGLAPLAWAADPVGTAGDTTVRLGITAGYGEITEDMPADAGAGLFGGEIGARALTASAFSEYGLPDLYTDADYDFAGIHNGYGNLAIVRLGLGRPIAQRGEIIPYVAAGYQNWYRATQGGGATAYFQSGLLGAGLKFDMPASQMLLLTASAEGLAVIGGTVSAPSQNFSGSVGTGAEERVGLDADYRLNQSWHVFAGLGLAHYNYARAQPNGVGGNVYGGAALRLNSMFGVAYGF